MIELARRNAAEAGAANVEFLHGTIEDVPLPGRTVDVIISNCVVNLSDDKAYVAVDTETGDVVAWVAASPISSRPVYAGVWTIQSGIFPENTASLSLHQALGFWVVGTRERMGRHHGTWRDVLLIERRNAVAGA